MPDLPMTELTDREAFAALGVTFPGEGVVRLAPPEGEVPVAPVRPARHGSRQRRDRHEKGIQS